MGSMFHDKISVDCKNCSIGGLCFPRGLALSEVDHVNKIIHRKRTLHRGDYIYRADDRFKSILALKAGTVKVISQDERGNEHILGLLLPGEMLGFDGFANGKHEYSAVALETTSICEVPSDRLEELCKEIPNLQRQLFQHMGCKLNEERCRSVMNKRPAEERLAYFLVDLSDRYSKRGFSASEYNLSLTRQEIGNYTGLALETVSRLFSRFQDEGLIEVSRRHITIKSPDRLREIFTDENNKEVKARA